MIEPFQQVVGHLEQAVRRLEAQTPAPKQVDLKQGKAWRYEEKTPQQALLQKLARYVSGLNASCLLLDNGYCQELGVIQRTLDEIEEDIIFLSLGVDHGFTERHNSYLEHFWSEEPGPSTVKRDKIRAYVHGGLEDPSSANDAGRTIYRTFSAYVHATSICIVDMWNDAPPQFQLAGMLKSPIYLDHMEDIWSSFFRGLIAGIFVAKAFGDKALLNELLEHKRAFVCDHADKLMPA